MHLNKHLPRARVCVNTVPVLRGSRGASVTACRTAGDIFSPVTTAVTVCVCEDTNPPGMGCQTPMWGAGGAV